MNKQLKRAVILGFMLAILLAAPIFAQTTGTVIYDNDSAYINAAGANPVIEAVFVGVVTRGDKMGPLYCAEMPRSRTQWNTTMQFRASPPQTSEVVLETTAKVDTSFAAKSTDAMSQTVSMESRGIVSVNGATTFQLTAFASKQQTLESGASFTATVPATQFNVANLPNQNAAWQVTVNAKSGSILSGSGNLVGEVNTFAGVELCAFYSAAPAKLGDFVWHDLNADGLQQPTETAVPSVTVTITGSYGLSLTTVTGPDGIYSSPELPPGNYCVNFTLPNGWKETKKGAGDVRMDSNGLQSCTSLAGGQDDLTMDLGLVTTNKVGDYCWQDSNVNGLQDQGEPPLAGCTFTALNDAQQIVQQVTTKADGRYEFANLPEGNLCIQMTPPAGQQGAWRITVQNAGDDAKDSDANAVSGKLGCIKVEANTVNLDFDVGLVKPQSAADPYIDSKISSSTVVTPGGTVIYTTTYGNNGPEAVEAVLTDRLPEHMTLTQVPDGCSVDIAKNVLTCEVGELKAGEERVLVTTFTASAEISKTTQVVNRVWISGISDADKGNNYAQSYVHIDLNACYLFLPIICNGCGEQQQPPPQNSCLKTATLNVTAVISHPVYTDGMITGVYTETKAISMTDSVPAGLPDLSYVPGYGAKLTIQECVSGKVSCNIILYGSIDDYQNVTGGVLNVDPTWEDAAEVWIVYVEWWSPDGCHHYGYIIWPIDP